MASIFLLPVLTNSKLRPLLVFTAMVTTFFVYFLMCLFVITTPIIIFEFLCFVNGRSSLTVHHTTLNHKQEAHFLRTCTGYPQPLALMVAIDWGLKRRGKAGKVHGYQS